MTMTRKGQAQATRPIPDWATLRPPVTEVAKVRFLPMDVIVRTPAELAARLAMGDFFLAEILEKGKVLYRRESP